MRLLELFAGSCAVSRAFASRGWKGVCVDLRFRHAPPIGFEEWITDALHVTVDDVSKFDFAWASSPCEEFSVHCMKFTKKKDHPYPELGVRLFNHTRTIFEASGVPYVMENVRCAEQFVGRAQGHAGSFYLWGTAVPPLLPKRLIKMGNQGGYIKRGVFVHDPPGTRQPAHKSATIPSELANCVADYAERFLEGKAV